MVFILNQIVMVMWKYPKNHMHIALEEKKVKKLKRLEEGNEILPDDPDKFESFSINLKKKHKIKL